MASTDECLNMYIFLIIFENKWCFQSKLFFFQMPLFFVFFQVIVIPKKHHQSTWLSSLKITLCLFRVYKAKVSSKIVFRVMIWRGKWMVEEVPWGVVQICSSKLFHLSQVARWNSICIIVQYTCTVYIAWFMRAVIASNCQCLPYLQSHYTCVHHCLCATLCKW